MNIRAIMLETGPLSTGMENQPVGFGSVAGLSPAALVARRACQASCRLKRRFSSFHFGFWNEVSIL